MPHVLLRTPVSSNVDAYRIASVTVVQTFHLETQMSVLSVADQPIAEQLNAMKEKITFSFNKF